jgi:uncharacterized PurR-regulated membrane protein YhhQ (DUF165 family)
VNVVELAVGLTVDLRPAMYMTAVLVAVGVVFAGTRLWTRYRSKPATRTVVILTVIASALFMFGVSAVVHSQPPSKNLGDVCYTDDGEYYC